MEIGLDQPSTINHQLFLHSIVRRAEGIGDVQGIPRDDGAVALGENGPGHEGAGSACFGGTKKG